MRYVQYASFVLDGEYVLYALKEGVGRGCLRRLGPPEYDVPLLPLGRYDVMRYVQYDSFVLDGEYVLYALKVCLQALPLSLIHISEPTRPY